MNSKYAFKKLLRRASLLFLFIGVLLAIGLPGEFSWLCISHLVLGLLSYLASFFLGGVTSPRSTFKSAKLGKWVNLFFLVAALIIGFILIRDHGNARFDTSAEKAFSLSDYSKQALSLLNKPVIARGFYLKSRAPTSTTDLLSRYSSHSPKFQWQSLDLDRDAPLADSLHIREKNSVHLSFKSEPEGGLVVLPPISEEAITNALLTLIRGKKFTVFILEGHDESDFFNASEVGYSSLRETFEGEGIVVQKINLLKLERDIPVVNSLLLIPAPRKELHPVEMQYLEKYFQMGGSAGFFLEPKSSDKLVNLLNTFGFIVGNDTVVAREAFASGESGLGVQPIISHFNHHEALQGFKQSIVMSTVRSVRKKQGVDEVLELAFTQEDSWAEVDLEDLYSERPKAELGEQDLRGPVPVAAVFDKQTQNRNQRIFVIGDVDFVANINVHQLFNRDFTMSLVNWALGNSSQVSIRPGSLRKSQIVFSENQLAKLFIGFGVILPEILILLGLYRFAKDEFAGR